MENILSARQINVILNKLNQVSKSKVRFRIAREKIINLKRYIENNFFQENERFLYRQMGINFNQDEAEERFYIHIRNAVNIVNLIIGNDFNRINDGRDAIRMICQELDYAINTVFIFDDEDDI